MTETEKATKGTGYAMPSECVQEVLESAKNASDKGSSQFFTPLDFAEACAVPLPTVRTNICDLNAGTGHFLIGAVNDSTRALLANDIQPVKTIPQAEGSKHGVSRMCADVTKLYALLKEVNWKCDLFVSNPPFDLHWYRDRLSQLSESKVSAVVEAFEQFDPRLGKDTIDSTCASLMIMLDLMPYRGEGVLIANEATLQRLIFGYRAPHSALANHIWAHLVIKGNPMTNDDRSQWDREGEKEYKTGVIWFAKSHAGGVKQVRPDLEDLEAFKKEVKLVNRYYERSGSSVSADYHLEQDCLALWSSTKDEWNLRSGRKTSGGYNIWLEPDGTIKTNLSLFDQRSVRIDKEEARKLFELNSQRPLQLVMQSQQRAALVRATNGKLWRVHPDLPTVVASAVASYHAIRSPLYALPDMQRMGFLDEHDEILCRKPMDGHFLAGKKYKVRTQTVMVERLTQKPNLAGTYEDILHNGQELAIYITDELGIERCFMEARHRAKDVKIDNITIDFFLEHIVEHFEIPDAPDVSVCRREEYLANLKSIDEIQSRIELKFKNFQREDLARGAVHDGFILGWQQGTGKSIGAIAWSLMKAGWDKEQPGFVPNGAILFVMPESLFWQYEKEGMDKFRVKFTKLDCQDTFLRLSKQGKLPPGYYLTSYTQLAMNKVPKFPETWESYTKLCESISLKPGNPLYQFSLEPKNRDKHRAYQQQAIPEVLKPGSFEVGDEFREHWTITEIFKQRPGDFAVGLGEEKNGISCTLGPSLSDLCKTSFECVIVDEGTRIKGKDTIIGQGVRQMNPKYRLVATGTPIKNRLPDIFHLAHWACGGYMEATPRFPYSSEDGEQEKFTQEFSVCERNLTKERAENGGLIKPSRKRGKWNRGKPTPQVCNPHRLWKLFAPIVLRRLLSDIGEEIVSLTHRPIQVPMGKLQAEVYQYHLEAPYTDKNGDPALGAKMQALRSCAAAPNSELLHAVSGGNEELKHISDLDYTPKIAATLTVIAEIMHRHEQVVVFSALHEPLDTMSRRLTEAGIPHDVLDGRKSPKARGKLADNFKAGLPTAKPVLLAGLKAMAEGHSWHLANNTINISHDWALDLKEQSNARVRRLNSLKPVNAYSILSIGTIDWKLDSMLKEKGNAAELVLDGRLLGENVQEISMAQLLKIAIEEFDAKQTLCEKELEKEWPVLRNKLGMAYQALLKGEPAQVAEPVIAPALVPIMEVSTVPCPASVEIIRSAVKAPIKRLLEGAMPAVSFWQFA